MAPLAQSEGEDARDLGRFLPTGTVLRGKYRIDGVIGTGGMAVVYAATHRNRKRFAVKMLHPELSTRQEVRARFIREGYVANSVEHPGVVSVLDDDVTEDGSAFLVMELLEGATVEGFGPRSRPCHFGKRSRSRTTFSACWTRRTLRTSFIETSSPPTYL
jgi:serine/threonine protein kinase